MAVEVVVVFVVVPAVFVKVKQQLTATTSEWLKLFLMTNLEASLRIDLFSSGRGVVFVVVAVYAFIIKLKL